MGCEVFYRGYGVTKKTREQLAHAICLSEREGEFTYEHYRGFLPVLIMNFYSFSEEEREEWIHQIIFLTEGLKSMRLMNPCKKYWKRFKNEVLSY